MSAQRKSRLDQMLDRIVDRLVMFYRPERIILFGSVAAGRVGDWSDLDIVIIKETSKTFLQRSKEVALLCAVPVGVDYLVYTPQEFQRMIEEKNPFILEEVIRRGKTLYERQPVRAVA